MNKGMISELPDKEQLICTCGCGCDFESRNQDNGGRCLSCINNDHNISGSSPIEKIAQLKLQNKGETWFE